MTLFISKSIGNKQSNHLGRSDQPSYRDEKCLICSVTFHCVTIMFTIHITEVTCITNRKTNRVSDLFFFI